tara:strand:- start:255 stop:422 length:168 start_codon:yes stop_codon:yes gene_type:complete
MSFNADDFVGYHKNQVLPKEKDFDPYALCPWKDFGGLSIEEAYAKSCENSSFYKE